MHALQAKEGLKRVFSNAAADDTVYLPDRAAVASAVNWQQTIPAGVESALVHHVSPSSGHSNDVVLILLSERPRAWSSRERLWAAAMARKLQAYW